jgi:microcystin-dependent protein
MTSMNRETISYTAHQKPTVGDYKTSAVSSDHLGWMNCDGRLLNISDYTLLFNVIQYSFGSNAKGTQFKLPNPAGKVPGFVGSGSGLTFRSLGDSFGEETHILSIAEMPTHSHTGTTSNKGTGITLTDPGHAHSYTRPSAQQISAQVNTTSYDVNAVGGTTVSNQTGITLTDPQHNHNFTTQTTGLSDPFNVMQPTLFIGNLFIYSGKQDQGTYPYTDGYYGIPPISNNVGLNIQ